MSTPAAQIRVRLSAEGVKDVVAALKQVERQAKDTAGSRGLGAINGALRQFKTLVPALGVAAVAVGFASLAKKALDNADALAKMSARTNATVEDLSALSVAGRLADVSQEQLQGGIVRLSRALGELKSGSKTAQQAFAQIGLSMKDIEGLDTAQAFELISRRVLAIKDPFRQVQVGSELLGKGFADLIPLMQAVADEGLAGLKQRFQEMGLLITGDLAGAAEQAKDSLELIKMQAEGLATSFISGLAPSIVAAMSDVSDSIKGDGVEEMKRFGEETGRVLRTVIATFRLFFTVVSGILTKLGNNLGGVFAAVGAGLSGNFREAARNIRDIGEQNRQFDKLQAEKVKAALDGVVKAATSDPPVIPVKLKPDNSKLQAEIAAAMEKADRAAKAGKKDNSAEREAEKARREAERLAEEQRRRDESAAETRFDLEQRLLELTGRGSEAKLRALDAEIAKQREILRLATGGVSPEDEAKLGQVRTLEASRIALEEALAVGTRGLDELAAARTRIEQDVELGIVSQYEGTQRILALEKSRLPILQAIATAALAAAKASGDPAAIADAEALTAQVRQIELSVLHASDSFLKLKEGAKEALHSGLTEVLTNLQSFDSVGDVFKSLASSVASSLQRIAAEMLATYIQAQLLKAAMAIFGGGSSGGSSGAALASRGIGPMKRGGLIGYAGGGTIDATGGGLLRGPGTGTSDSIPAITTTGKPLLVSNGEFVVNAAATARHLDLLKTINDGHAALNMPIRGPRRLARGGLTGGELRGGEASSRSNSGFAGVLGLEEGLVLKHFAGADGERVLLRHLKRNTRFVKSLLR